MMYNSFQSKVFGLRNHQPVTSHHVNTSESLAHKSANDNILVKVYGEANPSKTDEKLMDIEANTQIMSVNNGPSSLLPSVKSVHNLSTSGYRPPEEKSEAAETNQETENVKEMQTVLCPPVENSYDGSVLNEGALTAETPSMDNKEESERVGQMESTVITYAEDHKTSTESMKNTNEGFVEMVTEQNGASTDYQATDGSKDSYDVNSKQFKSTSVGTEATEMSTIENVTTESIPEGYGLEKAKAEPETNETLNDDSGFKLSESVKESYTTENITHTLIDAQTGAEHLRHEATYKSVKGQSTAEKNLTTTLENLAEPCEAETSAISHLEDAAQNATSTPVSSEETKVSAETHQKVTFLVSQENTTVNEKKMNTDETYLSETVQVTSPVTTDASVDNLYSAESSNISNMSSLPVIEFAEAEAPTVASHGIGTGCADKNVIPGDTSVTSSVASATSGVVNVVESATAIPGIDFGYGDSNGNDDTLLNSVSTTISVDTTKNPCSSQHRMKLNESPKVNESATTDGIMATDRSGQGYDTTRSQATTKSEIVEGTSVSTQEISEMTSVNEGSLESESPESEVSSYAIPEKEKPTETPISETVPVQVESKEILKDMIDFSYGGEDDNMTEAQFYETKDSENSGTVTKPVMQFTDEAKNESVQQSSATETSPGIESTDTSQQNYTEVGDTTTSSSFNNETKETIGVAESDDRPAVISRIRLQQITGSTLMHIITNEIDTSTPFIINEEAPKVIAITKVTKKGPSKLADDIIASTKGKEKEEGTTVTEISKEFEAESKLGNEMDDTSPKSPAVATATDNTELEFRRENTTDIPGEGVSASLEPSGYGNVLTSDVESVMTTMEKSPNKHTETSIASELSSSDAYGNSETFAESESKISKESISTVSSVTSNDSYGETITVEDDKNVPNNIPIGAKSFGYDADAAEVSSSGTFTSVIASRGVVSYFPSSLTCQFQYLFSFIICGKKS